MMGLLKNKAEWVINFVLRGIMGMLGIYFLNMVLATSAFGVSIGYNLYTFLVSGMLGLPGVALMYGIHFYMIL
jgi:inhibitor of the pro-sigma K processing machinery